MKIICRECSEIFESNDDLAIITRLCINCFRTFSKNAKISISCKHCKLFIPYDELEEHKIECNKWEIKLKEFHKQWQKAMNPKNPKT